MIGYFDGSCEPINPGGTARFGWAILADDGSVFAFGHGVIGTGLGMTNNVAEYKALVSLLQRIMAARENGLPEGDVDCVCGDSLLVVNMVNGRWGKKNPHRKAPHLVGFCLEARQLLSELGLELMWIPREENTIADYYSKYAAG